jgi:hypothetical protein
MMIGAILELKNQLKTTLDLRFRVKLNPMKVALNLNLSLVNSRYLQQVMASISLISLSPSLLNKNLTSLAQIIGVEIKNLKQRAINLSL